MLYALAPPYLLGDNMLSHLNLLSITDDLYSILIKDDRWKYFVTGLKNTLIITLFAAIMGVVIGFLIAIVRSSADKLKKADNITSLFAHFKAVIKARSSKQAYKKISFGRIIFYLLDDVCRLYLTVIRGTPVIVQLMIINYWILTSMGGTLLVAIIAFGINSGAYVAEIVRSGIMSIDVGQEEAGRSLGMNFVQTMIFVIIPQAVKNILPALVNEAIVLLKATSVSGYVAIFDLTKGGDVVRSITWKPLVLFIVAAIYLVVVLIMTKFLGKLERRLRNSER